MSRCQLIILPSIVVTQFEEVPLQHFHYFQKYIIKGNNVTRVTTLMLLEKIHTGDVLSFVCC